MDVRIIPSKFLRHLPGANELIILHLVLHICVGELGQHGSDNGLCLDGTKSLFEPMLPYCQLDTWEISVKFKSEFYHFHSRNAFESVICQNVYHFVQGGMS